MSEEESMPKFGTGIYAASLTTCSSTDQTWYCRLSRVFSAFMMFLVFAFVVYYVFKYVIKSRK